MLADCAGLLRTGGVEENPGSSEETTAGPSTTNLDLFPGNAVWLCWEELLGPCQAPALFGWSAAQDVNAPSALRAGLHSP